MDEPNSIGDGLEYKTIGLPHESPILLLEWRRKNIESYLLCPNAIARATGQSVDNIKQHIQRNFALAIKDDGYMEADPPEAIITSDGKHIFTAETIGLQVVYHCDK